MKLENKTLQAIVRKYRNKFQSVRTLSMAGIAREDMLFEYTDARIEFGEEDEVKTVEPDCEDQNAHNQVAYSYIDNELLQNENQY